MWPLAWPSVNELEAGATSVAVVLASVFTTPLACGGETAPPGAATPVALLSAATVVAAAASAVAVVACSTAGAGLEQATRRATDKAAAMGSERTVFMGAPLKVSRPSGSRA